MSDILDYYTVQTLKNYLIHTLDMGVILDINKSSIRKMNSKDIKKWFRDRPEMIEILTENLNFNATKKSIKK